MKPDAEIGSVVLVRLRLEARPGFPNLDWHCLDVKLKMSSDDTEVECFPCYRWITTTDGDVELRSNKGKLCNHVAFFKLKLKNIQKQNMHFARLHAADVILKTGISL